MKTVKDGNVCVEVYKGKLPTTQEIEQEKDKALSPYQDGIRKLQEEKIKYQKLGFEAQAKIVETKLQTVKRKAMVEEGISPEKFGYQVISPEDMAIWALWLPSEYREKEFLNYQFDQIPQIALDEYAMAKELRMFETFTIRTPERERVQDPAIFGYFWRMVNGELKKVPVLITRWAESLRPFEEIKAITEKGLTLNKRAIVLSFVFGVILFAVGLGVLPDFIVSHVAYSYVYLIVMVLGIGLLMLGIGCAFPDNNWVINWVLDRYRLPPQR